MSVMENPYGPPPGSSAGIAIGEEMGPIIGALKEGSAMTRYYANRKRQTPDLRIFMLKMEEFQLVWCRTGREGGRQEGSGITNAKTERSNLVLVCASVMGCLFGWLNTGRNLLFIHSVIVCSFYPRD